MSRNSDWGSSGARLLLDAVVAFDASASAEGEELVGPKGQTRVLRVSGASGSIINFEGRQEVIFKSGGWCVQRSYGSKAEDEGALRFWLDCESGAERGDVSVERGERLFFTTSVWDDRDGLAKLAKAAEENGAKLKEVKRKQQLRRERTTDTAAKTYAGNGGDDDNNKSKVDQLLGMLPAMLPGLQKLSDFREAVAQEEERTRLEAQQSSFRRIPSLTKDNAPAAIEKGGISVKRESSSAGALGGGKLVYHVLGSFEMEILEPETQQPTAVD